MVKTGADRNEKYSAKYDPEALLLRWKALRGWSIEKFRAIAFKQYLVQYVANKLYEDYDLGYFERGKMHDKLEKLLFKYESLTEPQLDLLRKDWIREGLLEDIFDKIPEFLSEIKPLFEVCAYPTSKLFSRISIEPEPYKTEFPIKRDFLDPIIEDLTELSEIEALFLEPERTEVAILETKVCGHNTTKIITPVFPVALSSFSILNVKPSINVLRNKFPCYNVSPIINSFAEFPIPPEGFRKWHVINPASGANTDYQVRIIVHFGSNSDLGEDVYLNEKCKTDFGDIRFYKSDGITELDYWLERKVDSDFAVFWVEIADSLESEAQTIYVSYGYPELTTTSNFINTFIEGDRFNRADSDAVGNTEIGDRTWTERGFYGASPDFDIVSNQLKVIAKASQGCTIPFSMYNFATEFIINIPSGITTNWGGIQIRKTLETHDWTTTGILIYFRDTGVIGVYGGSLSGDLTGVFTLNQEEKISIRAFGDSIKLYVNDVIQLDFLETTMSGGFLNFADSEKQNVIFDTFRVRKYVYPEPSHGEWGEEEGAP